ncbi:hypothetical protein CRN76_03565 [Chryseobacterium indologenes]|uniref:hypothetical protein n=1 Tax=Chryseobacterium indologenes TaxID=253 RepID=UPI000BFDC4E0|nr:hypothetical protein [Chryseobacterium indologenes]ATN04551.1 hypothetical protein CRN76_03565 [Chryseobacterium indologenes]AYY86698.1 hypothetical protein EGX91_20195 [Chryseobacterium indologenes]QIX83601.1 hypothetical protein FOB56_21180 [Chryseobacterium indologenes]TLX25019.1 hypothetical protein FE904_13750 [Chryseobacterium indologenes]UDQ53305.1 hypothetical protein LJF28_17975 [Chryseobacterium indologenes]
MKRMIIASLFSIIACKEEKKENITQSRPQVKEEVVQEAKSQANESEEAKKWLQKNIEDYFKADLVAQEKVMQKITTKEYFDYKTDATNVDLDVDGSLTEKEFEDKWKKKFDIKKAGIGVGFLISGQDWDEIKVSECKLLESKKNDFLFDIVLADEKMKAKYPIKVKVIKNKDSFVIADVWQEESKLN